MSAGAYAFRYARALYETAEEQGRLDEAGRDVETIAGIIEGEPEIRNYCLKSRLDSGDENRFAEIALIPYVGPLCQALVRAAVRNGRIAMLPFLPSAFSLFSDSRSRRITVTLETAQQTGPELADYVRKSLEVRMNKSVIVKEEQNPSLVGGFRLWYSGKLLDASVTGRLNRLKRHLRAM